MKQPRQIFWFALQIVVIGGVWGFLYYVIGPTMDDPPGLGVPLVIGIVAALLVTVAVSATARWLGHIPTSHAAAGIALSIAAGAGVYALLLPGTKVTDQGAAILGVTTTLVVFFVIVGVSAYRRRS